MKKFCYAAENFCLTIDSFEKQIYTSVRQLISTMQKLLHNVSYIYVLEKRLFLNYHYLNIGNVLASYDKVSFSGIVSISNE